METITLTATQSWPENEYEGSAFFDFHGQNIEARAVLSGEDEWKTWVPGRVFRAEVCLLRIGAINKTDDAPAYVRVGRASYDARGRVTSIVEHAKFILDVGFPLLVDWDSHAMPMPGVGDQIAIYGEMQIDVEDDA